MPRARRSQNASVEYTETRFRIDFFISPIGVDWRSTGRVTASFFGFFFLLFFICDLWRGVPSAIYGRLKEKNTVLEQIEREREREKDQLGIHWSRSILTQTRTRTEKERNKQTNKKETRPCRQNGSH